jgi:hypothetical protein
VKKSFVGPISLLVPSLALLSGCQSILPEAKWQELGPTASYRECGRAKGVLDEDGFVNVEALASCVKAVPISEYEPSEEDGCQLVHFRTYSGSTKDPKTHVEFVPRDPGGPWKESQSWETALWESVEKWRPSDSRSYDYKQRMRSFLVDLAEKVSRPEKFFAEGWGEVVAPKPVYSKTAEKDGYVRAFAGYTRQCLLELIPEYASVYRRVRVGMIRETLGDHEAFDCLWETTGPHPDEACQKTLDGFADRYVRFGKLVESLSSERKGNASPRTCAAAQAMEAKANEGIRPTEDDRQFAERRSAAQAALATWRAFEAGKASAGDASAVARAVLKDQFECMPRVKQAIVKSVPQWRAALEESKSAKARADAQRADEAKAAAAKRQAERANADRQAVLKRRFEPLVEECRRSWQPTNSKCSELPGLSVDEVSQCQSVCSEAAVSARRKLVDDGRTSCIRKWAEAGTPTQCSLVVPKGATADAQWVKSETSACSAECRKDGPEARKQRVLAEQEAARAAAERARNPGPSAGRSFCLSQCKTDGMSCLSLNCGCDEGQFCPMTPCSAECLQEKNACDARCSR